MVCRCSQAITVLPLQHDKHQHYTSMPTTMGGHNGMLWVSHVCPLPWPMPCSASAPCECSMVFMHETITLAICTPSFFRLQSHIEV